MPGGVAGAQSHRLPPMPIPQRSREPYSRVTNPFRLLAGCPDLQTESHTG
jgi:hypothetical protein